MLASAISPENLTKMLEQFVADAPQAVAMEDGAELFDFATAKYSVAGEGKCVLHLWSDERNAVRRVVDAEIAGRTLRLHVLRFGQSQPGLLEICADLDRRTASGKRASRRQYQALLERVLRREYPGFRLDQLSSSPDLEHSLSPVYVRGMLKAGQSAFAVMGVSGEEPQDSIDAALTFGILWMDHQRRQMGARAVVEGLKLFLPPGRGEVLRQRAAHLNCDAAKWQMYELDERSEICEPLETSDSGNIVSHLTRAVDVAGARERFAASVERVRGLAPGVEMTVGSPSEVVFRLHGLEFARACIMPMSGSFRNQESILFGVAPAEFVLDDANEPLFRELVQRITEQRHAGGSQTTCSSAWRRSVGWKA